MYKNHKGKWSFFSKKTADMSPFSSWCGRIPIPFYNGMQAELVNIRQSEDCALFPLLNLLLSLRKSPGFPLQKCCRCLCVCVWSVWGKDWRGIRWKKDYLSYPPPQFVIKHNNNDDNINKNDNSPYNVFELNVSWGKYIDKNYLTFKISQTTRTRKQPKLVTGIL